MASRLFILMFLLTTAVVSGDENGPPLFGVSVRSATIETRFLRRRTEQEPVAKSLLNTNVTGLQTTVTDTRLRIIPDPAVLRFELLNSGDVTSVTTGVNRQAVIDSSGRHHFDVVKPFWFDGTSFLTSQAYGTFQAWQTPQRVVSTVGARMPALSRLGDRIAWNEVMRRQPQINQAVAIDVSKDVLPKIDRIVDEDFHRLGREWSGLQSQVRSAIGNTRLRWQARSTEQAVVLWSQDLKQLRQVSPMPVPADALDLTKDDDLIVFVSETAVTTLVDRWFPSGLKLTDSQLLKLQSLGQTTDAPETAEFSPAGFAELAALLRQPAEPATLYTIEFSKDRPLRVRFADGDIQITATFQVVSTLSASSGWMSTTFALRGKRMSADHWTVAVRNVDVGQSGLPESLATDESLENESNLIPQENPADSSGNAIVQTGTVWIPLIRSTVESFVQKLPPLMLPLQFRGVESLTGDSQLRLVRVNADHGMLKVGLRFAEK